MRDVDGKLRYNRNGKAKTRQPKKSDVLIVAIIREGALLTVKLWKSLGQMKEGSFKEHHSFDAL